MIANKETQKLPKSSVRLTVTVAGTDTQAAYDEIVKDFTKNAQIKGFRRGHVPAGVLLNKFGAAIREEALRHVLEKATEEAFETIEEKPIPYSQPRMDGRPEFDAGKDFTFSVLYDVFPQVTYGAFKGLAIEEPVVKIEKEDVERELERIQDQNSITIDKDEGTVERKNIVSVNYCELDESGAEKTGTGREGFSFTVGSGYNLYDFDDDILGMKKDEERSLTKTFADDYKYPELAGKSVTLRVKVVSIREKQLPEVNDELAQDVSEKFKTLEDLKKDIVQNLDKKLAERLREKNSDAILTKLIDGSSIDLPDSMVDAELSNRWYNFVGQFRVEEAQVMKILQMQGRSRESLLAEWRPQVERIIKGQLIVEDILEKEKIEASDEEAEIELGKQAEASRINLDEAKSVAAKNNLMPRIKHQLAQAKVVDFLIGQAKISKGPKQKFMDVFGPKE